jgi:hypothetical protein
MKNRILLSALVLVTLLTSCEVVGDIFKAGAYTGIIVVVIIIVLILWLFNRFRGRG